MKGNISAVPLYRDPRLSANRGRGESMKTYYKVRVGDILEDEYGNKYFVSARPALEYSTVWDGPRPILKPEGKW